MSARPFTLAEFGQLVSAALESDTQERGNPEPLTTASSRHSFLSFSTPKSRRPGLATNAVRHPLSVPPKSFFSFTPHRMLHHPVPIRPMDAMAPLDLTQSCMPLYHHGTSTPSSSRPRARQLIEKIKRQASALVKSPSRRIRPHSCANPDQFEQTLEVPTVNFISASPVESSFSGGTSSVSCSYDDDAHLPAILHIDAPAAGDFVPYLPLASRLEREPLYATDALAFGFRSSSSRLASASTPPPLSDAAMKLSVILPSSPSPSERSDSTASISSPVTPVYSSYHDVHPYWSPTVMSQRWSVGSYEQDQNNDTFLKGKVQIVRRNLIQDSFLVACAAVADKQQGPTPVEDNGSRSPKAKRSSVFKKKSNASLPPLKPPPSCPLPSPPSACSESSVSIHSVLERPTTLSADQEWTLFLGAPSKPLEVLATEGEPRKRAGSLSVPSPSSKQHLSPTDIPTQVQPRARTTSNLSTRSNATGRRIESGPAPDPEGEDEDVFDWTLSLPVLKKPKSTLSIEAFATVPESPVELKARKCKSFTDWTVDLSDPYERRESRLREKERELERERRSSRASVVSVASARAASQRSVIGKRLPIGPGSSSSSQIPMRQLGNASTTSLNCRASKSTTSLHSVMSSASSSTNSSYKDSLPFDPCSPDVAPVSPVAPSFSNHSAYADSLFIIPNARPPSLISSTVSSPSISSFPLPPSFSDRLSQRTAAPPLPSPLRPIGKYWPQAQSSSVYADPSHASTSTALPTISSLSAADLDAHVASSAPATSLHFPPSSFPSASLRRLDSGRPESYYYRPTTSSSVDSETSVATTSSTVSAASSESSVRTASSASTVVPRTKTPRLRANMNVDVQRVDRNPSSPPKLSASEGAGETRSHGPVRPSFESSAMATEYNTCNEGGSSDEDATSLRRRSPVEDEENSECYYSARSSLDL